VSYIDPNLPAAKLHRALGLKFPGQYIHFIDYSQDGGELLFEAASDRNPGSYLLIDTHTYKVSKLFDAAPWIDPAKMAERRPLKFKASDGTELEAILTLPPDRSETNLPMVLLPHGGPIGVSDDWFYDDDAQFLANRGYLVLQVNYRGSSGRGEDFKEGGYLKWGTRIQQDLIDGVKYAIAGHYADPSRVCVYGGSFGGYSAMMTVIRAPGMFKCAVGYAGVYDLKMMYKKGSIGESQFGRSYLHQVIGKDDADLDANSPDKLAEKIAVPVLLIHGEDDKRVPFAQAKAMRAALEAAHKPYEWMSKPGEGHGFYDEKNRVDFYNALQAFLEKHIGKGA
jgi:dipeptidyl aminopeptidase/acylaminoacyl peptidase